LIKAGELSGHLDEVLVRLSEHLETRRSLLQNVRSALNYPLIVGGVAMVVVGLVLTQVVPIFEEVFSQMGANLPLPTQWLIGMSRQLVESGALLTTGAAVVVILMNVAWKQFALLRAFLLRVALLIPVLGPLWLLTCQQRFTATLAVLLESGLPLPDSLELAGEAANHPVFRRAGEDIRRRVEQGQSLAESMSQCRTQVLTRRIMLFTPVLVHLVKLGEGSGQLDEMISRWSRDAQKRLTTRLLGLSDWLEPGLMVLMGVMVGGLVMALYLPMFQMGQHF
jgi:type IV pilus assembly protein PilC